MIAIKKKAIKKETVKNIEDIAATDIVKLEIATGEPIIYSFSDNKFKKLDI